MNIVTYSRGNSKERCGFLGNEYFRGGTIISETFGPLTGYYGGSRIFRNSARACNWRGCFQPMIDVKDVVMLSGFVQPSNSNINSL